MNQNDVGILPDGSVLEASFRKNTSHSPTFAEALAMKTLGYWQLHSKPGVWKLDIKKGIRGSKLLMMKYFVNRMEVILVKRKEGWSCNWSLIRALSKDYDVFCHQENFEPSQVLAF
eukprot:scaffold1853_cov287-Chaetoceros_neogracile.AAC.19